MKQITEKLIKKEKFFGLYRGIVEDNNDPLKAGRIKVRIYGIHTFDKDELPTNALPWAEPIIPNFENGDNFGEFSVPDIGTLVFVLFENGNFNYPLYLGVSTCIKNENNSEWNKYLKGKEKIQNLVNKNQINVECINENWKEKDFIDELNYPNGKIINCKNGIILYINNSESSPSIVIIHPSGNVFLFDKEGNLKIKSFKETEFITLSNRKEYIKENKYETIGKNYDIEIKNDLNIKVNGNANIEVLGNVNLEVDGDVEENIMGDKNSNINGNYIINVNGNFERNASIITDRASQINHE